MKISGRNIRNEQVTPYLLAESSKTKHLEKTLDEGERMCKSTGLQLGAACQNRICTLYYSALPVDSQKTRRLRHGRAVMEELEKILKCDDVLLEMKVKIIHAMVSLIKICGLETSCVEC